MSLSDIDFSQAVADKNEFLIKKLSDELFTLQMRVKRTFDSGVSLDDAKKCEAVIAALDIAKKAVDNSINAE